jgi:dual specificity MAP kinase phosphatase
MDDRPQPGGRNDGHVFDYSQITDQIFVGSDFCKGGVCLIHGEEFKKLEISVEINLSQEDNELPPKRGISSYTWLPVEDGAAPTQAQLAMGTSIIDNAVNSGLKVYVHCRNGHARSPSLVTAYLVKYKGMSLDDAYKLIKEKRPESHIEKSQKLALNEFLSK